MRLFGGASRPRIRKVEVVANIASGSVGPDAPDEVRAILAEFGLSARVLTPQEDGGVDACLKKALAARPDLLIVLAGDGTARAAAEQAGPRGPLIAPLPGGTMNMLPKALYGEADWKAALTDTLARGVERPVGGGVIGGHAFYVAAMLGATALFAPAREAARERHMTDAWMKAREAYRKAFSGRTRYALDGGEPSKAQSLTLMCPLISKVMDDEARWMEAAAINPRNTVEAMRIGARVALSPVVGDWRSDPAVETFRCRKGRVWTRAGSLPALLDGEPIRLGRSVEFRFNPCAFRALAPEAEPSDMI